MRPNAESANKSRRIYIAWKSECFRGLQSAHVFGLELVLIKPMRGRGLLRTIARYVVSGLMTIRVLVERRPTTLGTLNQPLPLALIGWIYSRLTGAKLILDGHSKVYDERAPKWQQALYRRISRDAYLTLNHNRQDAAVLERWGARGVLLETLPFALPVPEVRPATSSQPYVLVVCSFAADEPIDVLLDAARLTPELHIKMTGDFTKAGLKREDFPPNVEPTGFLSTQDYYDTFAGAAAIVTLSTRNWIMQMAVGEALLLGVPVVTNKAPILQAVIADGGVFVDLTAEDLARGVREVIGQNKLYKQRVKVAGEAQRERVRARLANAEEARLEAMVS